MPETALTNLHEDTQKDNKRLGNSPYTISEAASILRMSEKSIRRQIDRGHLRRCKVFGRVLIPRKDVDNFMERHSAYAFAALSADGQNQPGRVE